jgi:hypothetical protein
MLEQLLKKYIDTFNLNPHSEEAYEKYYDLFDYVYHIYFSKVYYEGDIPDSFEPDYSVTHIDYNELLNRILEVIK